MSIQYGPRGSGGAKSEVATANSDIHRRQRRDGRLCRTAALHSGTSSPAFGLLESSRVRGYGALLRN
ncbi:uncharacterized [Tachysurus ichikawai]